MGKAALAQAGGGAKESLAIAMAQPRSLVHSQAERDRGKEGKSGGEQGRELSTEVRAAPSDHNGSHQVFWG